MDYFKFDIWKKINSDDPATRDMAEKQWQINSENYFKKYDFLKAKLPIDFVSVYKLYSDFHDALIEHISIEKNNVCIYLAKRNNKIAVKYTDVKYFNVDFRGQDMDFGLFCDGDACWGYDEFSVDSDGYLVHNILTDIGSEIKIKFETISAKECQQPFWDKAIYKIKNKSHT